MDINKGCTVTNWTPEVGEGATVRIHTDRIAGTITEVSASGRRITFREDRAVLLNGANSGEEDALVFHPGGFAAVVTGTQRYRYEPDPDGYVWRASYRPATGEWVTVGHPTSSPGMRVTAGRHAYHDYGY